MAFGRIILALDKYHVKSFLWFKESKKTYLTVMTKTWFQVKLEEINIKSSQILLKLSDKYLKNQSSLKHISH